MLHKTPADLCLSKFEAKRMMDTKHACHALLWLKSTEHFWLPEEVLEQFDLYKTQLPLRTT